VIKETLVINLLILLVTFYIHKCKFLLVILSSKYLIDTKVLYF